MCFSGSGLPKAKVSSHWVPLELMPQAAQQTHIADLYEETQRLEQEINDLLLEKIQSGG